MQILLNTDQSLLNEALELTDITTQEDLLKLALQEFVRSRQKKNLLDLAGHIQLADGLGSANYQMRLILSTNPGITSPQSIDRHSG